MRAAEYGDSERVKLLLKEEARGSVSKYDVKKALVGASEGGHSECVKLLLEAAAHESVSNFYLREAL